MLVISSNDTKDIMAEIKGALQQVKEHLDGKIQLNSVDTLINELRNNNTLTILE